MNITRITEHLRTALNELRAADNNIENGLQLLESGVDDVLSDADSEVPHPDLKPDTDFNTPVTPTPSAGQWHANGWSLYADDEGLVESSVITPLYRRLPRPVQAKMSYLFDCHESYFSASYPHPLAQLLAQQHLSSRRTVIIMDDHSQVWEVARYEVTTVKPDKPNYDVPPWAQEQTTWKQVEVRMDAWAMDWDPAKNHAYVVKLWKERARAELESQGYKPGNFGL